MNQYIHQYPIFLYLDNEDPDQTAVSLEGCALGLCSIPCIVITFLKHAYSDRKSDIFHNSALNIDCGYSLEPPRRGGSNEYPQSIFFSRNKKKNVYPSKTQFYYIKVGFELGSKLYRYVFDVFSCLCNIFLLLSISLEGVLSL